MRETKIKLGRKTFTDRSYDNGYVKPGTKYWKRQASKKVRRTKDIPNGRNYRKVWGWFEWC